MQRYDKLFYYPNIFQSFFKIFFKGINEIFKGKKVCNSKVNLFASIGLNFGF